MADAYLLTFDNVPSAVAAWAELVAKGAEFPDPHLDGLHFCAGLEQGELRIYKNSVYGEASPQDAKELHEEGIEFHPLPVLPEERN